MKGLSSQIAVSTVLLCGMIAIGPAARAQDGAANYKGKCAMCHGADGKGSAIGQKMGVRDFTSAEVKKETDAQLSEIISKGKGKMPSYQGKLSDAEIKGLVTYIRSLAK